MFWAWLYYKRRRRRKLKKNKRKKFGERNNFWVKRKSVCQMEVQVQVLSLLSLCGVPMQVYIHMPHSWCGPTPTSLFLFPHFNRLNSQNHIQLAHRFQIPPSTLMFLEPRVPFPKKSYHLPPNQNNQFRFQPYLLIHQTSSLHLLTLIFLRPSLHHLHDLSLN